MKALYPVLFSCLLSACTHTQPAAHDDIPFQSSLVNEQGKTIETRFNVPDGYHRKATSPFGSYLRKLPLKAHGSIVHYYDGGNKTKPVYDAVVDMEIGNKDLQQCADAVMRLWAEYLFAAQQPDKIHFNFTNGFRANYSKWADGNRISVSGNNVSWAKSSTANSSYSSFRSYMDVVFSYAGTLSLSRELKSVPLGYMQIGDVLIQGGSPGHAVIVVDMAENRLGKKIYMLAQSYMPAQDIQVLSNKADKSLSPWYELDTNSTAVPTPEWDFTSNDLKRFTE